MERFDPDEALALIERHRVTHSQWVPTMFIRMLKLPAEVRERYDVSSLQVAIHAAAPCPVAVKQQMIEWWGPVLHEYYAGTEGNGFVYCDSAAWLAHPGTVGSALVGTVHIVDDDGEELPPGERGTVYFGGGAEFSYHNDPEKTAASRDARGRGWSTLGDVGYVDEDGFLYLTDRKAYMIITGGVNVYPQEAENVLALHPKVADVAVLGVPNDDFGEEVKAVVEPISMDDAGPELERELIAYCREHLADVKCPRSVDFRAELPRHPTGKLYKRLLKDEYWAGHDQPDRVNSAVSDRRLVDRGPAGEAVIGPVPPGDGVLPHQPAQPVPAPARRLRREIDEATVDVAQHDALGRELVEALLDGRRVRGHQAVAVLAHEPRPAGRLASVALPEVLRPGHDAAHPAERGVRLVDGPGAHGVGIGAGRIGGHVRQRGRSRAVRATPRSEPPRPTLATWRPRVWHDDKACWGALDAWGSVDGGSPRSRDCRRARRRPAR